MTDGGRRTPQQRTQVWNDFVCRNALWFFAGLLFVQAAVIGGERYVFSQNDQQHRATCDAARQRQQTTLDFWANTSSSSGSHGSHETSAQTLWTQIGNEMAREHVGSSKLTGMIAQISGTWGQLAADDAAKASYQKGYGHDLEAEFNSSCGPAPTPRPLNT